MTVNFRGVIPALVTPFTDNGVDYPALRAHVDWLIKAGVNAVVPCGTTGESPTLTNEEHNRVVTETVEAAAGRIPVLAGTGSNSTAEAIDMSKHAQKAGASGLLLVSPYYNKPTQEGLYRHFVTVAEAAGLPVILYNIPSRCGVNILPETVAKLAEHELIVGVKEATGDLNQMIRTIELCGPGFLVTCGDDGLSLPLWSVGGGGVISVAANAIPGPIIALWREWEAGKVAEARKAFFDLLPFFKAIFLETNPIPIKFLMGLSGVMSGRTRLPMCPPSAPVQQTLKDFYQKWSAHFPAPGK
ncbi:MAG: 4-hydroxy-tetrahydrodipicolinate synthase [Deltaproteobacteria bacterium]|jgi:4-hydroxy-tetrahydrodipicolinate synthase|nr:4-hydroxy-tetrahydrodipicolinate synthase [Deltaproteobacteria bacterium]